jgi:hypothetical protein
MCSQKWIYFWSELNKTELQKLETIKTQEWDWSGDLQKRHLYMLWQQSRQRQKKPRIQKGLIGEEIGLKEHL